MVCSWCSSSLSVRARGDSRYCSSRCRVAAHRSQPPRELRDRARWIRWTRTKVPLTVNATPASSTDPSTWFDYDTAAASDVGAGIGFVLNGDGIVCVDLDHCLDGKGRPLPWAADILADLPDTYVEVSPSGDGLHVWGHGTVGKGRRSDGIEVYGTGRYLTVTGRRWRHARTTLGDIDAWIATLDV